MNTPSADLRRCCTLALALAALVSCGQPQEATPTQAPPPPALCDAGEQAFVHKAFALMWGSRPQGAAELTTWADASARYGRDTIIEAMASDPAYSARWRSWITDALMVARTGDRAYPGCFSTPMMQTHDGSLARFVAETAADGPAFTTPFNMADLIVDGLAADDLSVIWRANLFARMFKPVGGANVGPNELENNRRIAFGDELYDGYLGRNLTCLPCHNSEFSTTDSQDPATDRAWPVPGLFERALLGNSYGRDQESAYAVFRYVDLVRAEASTLHPWGLADACGRFAPANTLDSDLLGHEGYFIEAFGEAGSVWQVEAYLREGVDLITEAGLTLGDADQVDGPQAFAWLVAQSIVDQVWEAATGERLTIATGFARNQAQRDILMDLTAQFVDAGFSLKALLTAVATHPHFNQGAPEACDALAYGMQPVYNPWSIADDDPERRMNGSGDKVFRRSARDLIRAVHASLGWAQPAEFLARRDPLLEVQTALGAWMRTSQPGFGGTDFQGALAFEGTYGACARPSVGGASDGCSETLGHAGCASCTCQDCVCAQEPYCCEVQWDAICVSLCDQGCGGCGGGLASADEDVVDRLLNRASESGATVGDLVLALKDRLLTQGRVDDEEQALIEALLSEAFETRVSDAPELEPALRRLCGALLLSPDAFLHLDPPPAGPIPMLTLDAQASCGRAQGLLASVTAQIDCGGEP